jgi:hypothetical protein
MAVTFAQRLSIKEGAGPSLLAVPEPTLMQGPGC